MYNQLTLAQRYTISTMRQNGSSLQAIADELNRLREEEAALKDEPAPVKKIAASTIGRELNRNRNKRGGYSPGLAHETGCSGACHEAPCGKAMVSRTDIRLSETEGSRHLQRTHLSGSKI